MAIVSISVAVCRYDQLCGKQYQGEKVRLPVRRNKSEGRQQP